MITISLDDSILKIPIFFTRLLQESLYRLYLYTTAKTVQRGDSNVYVINKVPRGTGVNITLLSS